VIVLSKAYIEGKAGAGSSFTAINVRCSDLTQGSSGVFKFKEHFLRLPKNDPFDAILILGAQLNHDSTATSNQDVVNSWNWNGCTKKARSISAMLLFNIDVSVGQPSSLEDKYTEIQSCVSCVDFGREGMPGHASEGVLGFAWRRLILSTQGAYVGKQSADGCVNCEDIQNTVFDIWMSPKQYNFNGIGGLPIRRPLTFYHATYEFGNTYPKEAFVMWNLFMKVRFFASEKSLKYGE